MNQLKKNTDFSEDKIVEMKSNKKKFSSNKSTCKYNETAQEEPTSSSSNKRPHFHKVSFPVNYYFQPQPTVDSSKLKMTNISLYSTTPWREANFISHAIINFFKGHNPLNPSQPPNEWGQCPPIVLTDGTANVGGNTISFFLSGIQVVNAVEIDKTTCEMLISNLQTYKLPTTNVHCSDYLSIYKDLKQDVVFLDPPWGGPDYKKAQSLDLYLGKTNIIDICAELMAEKKASLIVLKLPINYNLPALIEKMPNRSFFTQKIYRCQNKHSYNVVFCF